MIILPDYKVKPSDAEKPEYIQASHFLSLFRTCERMRCMPKAGGLYDQDSLFVHLMQYTMVVDDERRKFDERKSSVNASKQP